MTGTRDPNHRVESSCDGCGQLDDHPKVVLGRPDGSWLDLHHDCFVIAGHDDPAVAAIAATGLRGADLLAHIKNGA